jgi:hypothetical protein
MVIIKKIFSSFRGPLYYGNFSTIAFLILGIFVIFSAEWQMEHNQGRFSLLNNKNWLVRKFSYAFLIVIILLIGVFDGGQFIYFQF